MREVEPQPVGRDQRALLRDVIAEHLAQRLVQKMRRRMIGADRGAARVIDIERKRGAYFQRALFHRAGVDEHVAGLLLGIGDAKAHAVRGHNAGVADLPAQLAIERRLVDDDLPGLALLEFRHFLAVAHQRLHDAFGGLGLVAEEFRRADLFAQSEIDRLFRGAARALP